jgi:hypothetical protein
LVIRHWSFDIQRFLYKQTLTELTSARTAQGCLKIGAEGTVSQESAVGSGRRPQRRRNRDG